MQLTAHSWGTGDRVALLVHGLMADHSTWRRVGPALADRGYRVLAVDLPGHGGSPRAAGASGVRRYSLTDMALAVTATCPYKPDLAVGHSLGAVVLERAIQRGLTVHRAVYSDPSWGGPPRDRAATRAYKQATYEQIEAANPRWGAAAVGDEVLSLERWDPETVTALEPLPALPASALVPSLVLLADPSERILPEQQGRLRARGFELRSVAGAGHSIHRDDFHGFMEGMAGWI
ncbi:alpha/beta fold hydrolase [Streptacidiphilus sp. N1-3]|uniref:Alpha/beta fold hydrolase n=1 Tax=Streptacidiphilus alkalitolerans TaxID=3342712 RepID=A0ABV6XBL2_9ACTN